MGKKLSSEQIRAARALLRWEQKRLSEAASIPLQTIKRLETKPGALSAYGTTIDALCTALEKAGIEFIAENGGGAGVRLKKTAKGIKELTQEIDTLEDKISSIPTPTKPSPEAGMNIMRKAVAKNDLAKLKTHRKRIKNVRSK
ncbi:MAG: hypothetical protein ABSD11_20965 [Methylocella sp.]